MFWKILVLLSLGLQLVMSCDMDQIRQGCRIQSRMCSCGVGCTSEYRYETIQECQNALKGKRGDICSEKPCLHGGTCLQISQKPGYKCRCEGTGYFGAICSRVCPNATPGSFVIPPFECIEI